MTRHDAKNAEAVREGAELLSSGRFLLFCYRDQPGFVVNALFHNEGGCVQGFFVTKDAFEQTLSKVPVPVIEDFACRKEAPDYFEGVLQPHFRA